MSNPSSFRFPEETGPFPVNPMFAKMEPFPLDALPGPVCDFIAAQARDLDCDPVSIALPVLATLASAIGSSRRIRLRRHWTEPAVLWTGVVCNSVNRPALDAAAFPLKECQQRAKPQRDQWMPQYERLMARYKAAKKQFT